MMEIDVYHGELADIDWLVEQCKAFSKFANYTKKPLFQSEEYAREFLTNLINQQVVFISKALKPEYQALFDELSAHGGKLEPKEDVWIRTGFIAGMLVPHFLNPDIICFTELFWWVEEQYRRSSSGLRLFKIFKEFGEDKADHIIMTLEDESSVNHSFLTKKGFRLKEFSFLLEV